MCGDYSTTLHDPIYGVKKTQQPFDTARARAECEDWRNTEARMPAAEAFLKDVTGIDTSSRAATWQSVKSAFGALTKWQTWGKLLMTPVPYPGAQGSTAVGSPNVTVNGGPLAFVAPLVATSCSDIPFVPNAMTLGFSNVLVGVTFADLVRGLAVNAARGAVSAGVRGAVRRASTGQSH